ncbi:MAG: nitronate monooxygenase [Bacillota bacterium]|nr:nitronate monooxygenase [Bacillota bacterium]
MDKDIKKINDILVNLFNLVLKLEEESIRSASSHDISITEIHTLVAVGTGRPRTMTHVANLLGVKVSTLTTAVNKLVKKGYVERLRDEKDRRIVKIRLTEQGVSAVNEHEQFHETMIREAISQVPGGELQQFISSIDNINQFLMVRSSMCHARSTPFAMEPLQLGAHQLPVPIVQAGMSIGVAGSRLASSVAIEGGLGLIGTSEIGYRSADYRKNRLKANLTAIEQQVSEACRIRDEAGGKGLIGVSIMWDRQNSGKYVEAAVKGGAQVIVTSAGIPKDLPGCCSDKRIALIPTISSKRAASAIIRSWSQKYNRVPDGFILQGPYAAGLLGFKEEQLDRAQEEWYRLIADVKAELSGLENCPLIAGGGIFHKKDAEKAYRYGADGFLMGTRFVATEECDAPEEYKKRYLNCTSNDVTIVKSPVKTLVRAMGNDFTDRLAEGGSDDYDIIEAVRRGVEGDYDEGLVFCGVNADEITEISTVKDVFREFTSS